MQVELREKGHGRSMTDAMGNRDDEQFREWVFFLGVTTAGLQETIWSRLNPSISTCLHCGWLSLLAILGTRSLDHMEAQYPENQIEAIWKRNQH